MFLNVDNECWIIDAGENVIVWQKSLLSVQNRCLKNHF
jgi:hypothetical protein